MAPIAEMKTEMPQEMQDFVTQTIEKHMNQQGDDSVKAVTPISQELNKKYGVSWQVLLSKGDFTGHLIYVPERLYRREIGGKIAQVWQTAS